MSSLGSAQAVRRQGIRSLSRFDSRVRKAGEMTRTSRQDYVEFTHPAVRRDGTVTQVRTRLIDCGTRNLQIAASGLGDDAFEAIEAARVEVYQYNRPTSMPVNAPESLSLLPSDLHADPLHHSESTADLSEVGGATLTPHEDISLAAGHAATSLTRELQNYERSLDRLTSLMQSKTRGHSHA